jgi:hypothetical protein
VQHVTNRSKLVVSRGGVDRLAAVLLGVGAVGAPARWGETGPWGDVLLDPVSADAERDRIRAIVSDVHRRRAVRLSRRRVRRTM